MKNNEVKKIQYNFDSKKYTDFVSKKVIRPIMFIEEENDSLIDFPMAFSAAINTQNIATETDYRNIQNCCAAADLDIMNRDIVMIQVYSFIISQSEDLFKRLVTNSFKSLIDVKNFILIDHILSSFHFDEQVKSLIYNVLEKFYSWNKDISFSSLNYENDQVETTLSYVKLVGEQIAQIIVTYFAFSINFHIKNIAQCSVAVYFHNQEDNINPELAKIYEKYSNLEFVSDDLVQDIKRYFVAKFRTIIESFAWSLRDLCVNTIIGSNITGYYAINDYCQYNKEKLKIDNKENGNNKL